MVRIFVVLAALSTALLVITFGLGLRIGDLNQANHELALLRAKLAEQGRAVRSSHDVPQALVKFRHEHLPLERRRTTHFLAALLTALFVLFVNSISITYFIGTARWCKEVAATYSLDTQWVAESQALKRHAFPWAMAAIGGILVTAALGAGADTDTSLGGHWAMAHYIAAMATIAVVVWAYLAQATDIRRNTQIVERMLDEVRRIRQERGLAVEDE